MKKIIAPLLILSVFALTSCKDDDKIDDFKQLPKTITSTSGNIQFTYSTSGQLVKVNYKDSDASYTETLFTYDNDGKIVKFVNIYNEEGSVETDSYNITYLPNNEAKIIDESNDYTLVKFNGNGQVLSFNNLSEVTTFTYDSNGNVVKISDNTSTTTVSYNNDKGILSGITSPKWALLLTDSDLFYFGGNNPVSVNYVYQNNGSTNTASDAYTYPIEHIVNGYPTRMLVKHTESGETTNETYSINY